MAISTVKTTINGQEYNLSYNSTTSKWEATISAPSLSSYNQTGGYYGVSVSATDDADNTTTIDSTDSTLGTSLRLVVKEKVAPVITILSPTSGALLSTATPTFTWNVTDDDSGVASSTISIDGGSAVAVTGTDITSGNTYSYTPSALADGSHTITVNATDNDGNTATAVSVTISIDTVPPVLNVTSPASDTVTNVSTITVAGTTSDVTSSPVTLTVNGTTVSVASDGSFSTTVTLAEGSNTIIVVATDGADRSTTVTRIITLDTGAPVFGSITITPNPVDAGATYLISVEVTD